MTLMKWISIIATTLWPETIHSMEWGRQVPFFKSHFRHSRNSFVLLKARYTWIVGRCPLRAVCFFVEFASIFLKLFSYLCLVNEGSMKLNIWVTGFVRMGWMLTPAVFCTLIADGNSEQDELLKVKKKMIRSLIYLVIDGFPAEYFFDYEESLLLFFHTPEIEKGRMTTYTY